MGKAFSPWKQVKEASHYRATAESCAKTWSNLFLGKKSVAALCVREVGF